MQQSFVSNSKESVRMFKSGFIESLSKVHYSVPLFVFVPVVLFCIYEAVWIQEIATGAFALSFLGGLFFWTLTEYVLHRFVFHFVPKSSWGLRLHFIFHGVHHDYPNDSMRLVLPPSVSVPLATMFFFIFKYALPPIYLYSSFSAFIIGYLFYDLSHYALHHANFKSGLWKKMKLHHMTHHYNDPTKGFGVSSALWDKVFQSDFDTDPKRKAKVEVPTPVVEEVHQ
jgi:sterol desaturase/sphingolipid hydroxylase (fatty acid hydroxylase superfamily)